jgi:hypothetical protein
LYPALAQSIQRKFQHVSFNSAQNLPFDLERNEPTKRRGAQHLHETQEATGAGKG